jgi:hypothetical protein
MATTQLRTVVHQLRRLAGDRPPERSDRELLRAFLADQDQAAFEAVAAGADDCLPFPVAFAELVTQLESLRPSL